MVFKFTSQFEPEIEAQMKGFFKSLSEKDGRRFAALEAQRLGHGGATYVAQVLGCSRRTIDRGTEEIKELPNDPAEGRLRRPGAGRKKRSKPTRSLSRI